MFVPLIFVGSALAQRKGKEVKKPWKNKKRIVFFVSRKWGTQRDRTGTLRKAKNKTFFGHNELFVAGLKMSWDIRKKEKKRKDHNRTHPSG